MKIKEISYGLTKSFNYNSVRVDLTAQIDVGDDVDKVFDELKQKADSQCSEDPSWMKKDTGVAVRSGYTVSKGGDHK
jgi:hypothetical protein